MGTSSTLLSRDAQTAAAYASLAPVRMRNGFTVTPLASLGLSAPTARTATASKATTSTTWRVSGAGVERAAGKAPPHPLAAGKPPKWVHQMHNPYTPPVIADGQELIEKVLESLKLSSQFASDALDQELHPLDALQLIRDELRHTLAVVKASKDLI